MNPECERIRDWLDGLDCRPLPPDLEAHAASCPACGTSVTAEQTLRDGLGATPPLDAARRAAMVAHALAAPAQQSRGRGRFLWWSWAPLAAAAAIVLVVILAWPQAPRNPISPTEVFGDFLGPLANFTLPIETPQTPEKEPSTTDNILATFWGDLETPLTVAMGALEAPRAAAGIAPAAQNPKPQTR